MNNISEEFEFEQGSKTLPPSARSSVFGAGRSSGVARNSLMIFEASSCIGPQADAVAQDAFKDMASLVKALSLILAVAAAVGAHSAHSSDNLAGVTDWATIHMSEEHHIDNFDPPSFHSMHDFNGDGVWTSDEVHRMLGLNDESTKDVSKEKKDAAVAKVFALFDEAGTGVIARDAWLSGLKAGRAIPDFGFGPGHHGDDEYEYEIHHFEKFHDENTKEEDLTHPEDIAHFRKHDLMEDEEERIAREQQQQIVENNIPMKFRKQQ